MGEGLGVGASHGEDKLDKGLVLDSTHERRILGQAGGSTLYFIDGQTENRPGLGNPPPIAEGLGLEVLPGVGPDLPPSPSYELWASSLLSSRAILSGLSLFTQETGLWRMKL